MDALSDVAIGPDYPTCTSRNKKPRFGGVFCLLHTLDGFDAEGIQTLLQRLRRQRGQLQAALAR